MSDSMMRVLDRVRQERVRQDEKWGQQNHADGTCETAGASVVFSLLKEMDTSTAGHRAADVARNIADDAARHGYLTWRDILAEEFFEAIEERDPEALSTELIQVAAVCVAWAECIERRAA